MSADRKPSLISWSSQYQADIVSVDTTFDYAEKKLVDLLPRRFEKYPAFKVKRGKDVDMESSLPFRRAQIEMTASASEVASAPEEMQKLFLDLGVQDGDEMAIELMIAKRNWRANPRRFADRVYSVKLLPTVYRPDLLGVRFNYAKQLWFLKSGTSVGKPEIVNIWYETNRIREMGRVYGLLEQGLVYDSYEEGTHASITRYRQKPHPYLAAIHRGTADWITGLIDSRMAK